MKRKSLNSIVAIIITVAFILSASLPAFAGSAAKININKASVNELVKLKKVGESYAKRIVEYRKKHGPFKKPEDIMNVKGIGQKIYEANKNIIVVK